MPRPPKHPELSAEFRAAWRRARRIGIEVKECKGTFFYCGTTKRLAMEFCIMAVRSGKVLKFSEANGCLYIGTEGQLVQADLELFPLSEVSKSLTACPDRIANDKATPPC